MSFLGKPRATKDEHEPLTETTPFLPSGQNQAQAARRTVVIKGLFYGLQNFYAFMLMYVFPVPLIQSLRLKVRGEETNTILLSFSTLFRLVFMTYNGWVMAAVSIGAFLGYILFGQSVPATKETACH